MKIRINDIPYAEIRISAKTEVGLHLPFGSKITYEYFLPANNKPPII
jgi:hypothetical protein